MIDTSSLVVAQQNFKFLNKFFFSQRFFRLFSVALNLNKYRNYPISTESSNFSQSFSSSKKLIFHYQTMRTNRVIQSQNLNKFEHKNEFFITLNFSSNFPKKNPGNLLVQLLFYFSHSFIFFIIALEFTIKQSSINLESLFEIKLHPHFLLEYIALYDIWRLWNCIIIGTITNEVVTSSWDLRWFLLWYNCWLVVGYLSLKCRQTDQEYRNRKFQKISKQINFSHHRFKGVFLIKKHRDQSTKLAVEFFNTTRFFTFTFICLFYLILMSHIFMTQL